MLVEDLKTALDLADFSTIEEVLSSSDVVRDRLSFPGSDANVLLLSMEGMPKLFRLK